MARAEAASKLHLNRAQLKRTTARKNSINTEANWANSPFLKKNKVTFDFSGFCSVCEAQVHFTNPKSVKEASFVDLKRELDAHSVTCRSPCYAQ